MPDDSWLYLFKDNRSVDGLTKSTLPKLWSSETWLTASEKVEKMNSIDNEGWEAASVADVLKEHLE